MPLVLDLCTIALGVRVASFVTCRVSRIPNREPDLTEVDGRFTSMLTATSQLKTFSGYSETALSVPTPKSLASLTESGIENNTEDPILFLGFLHLVLCHPRPPTAIGKLERHGADASRGGGRGTGSPHGRHEAMSQKCLKAVVH